MNILVVLHRKRRQLQAGDPAFGTVFQRGDVGGREAEAHHLVEKFGSFSGGKAQIGGAEFGQLAAGTQPRQRERWVFTGGNHQVHLRRHMLDQKRESHVNRVGMNHMVVIKDKDETRLCDSLPRRHVIWQRGNLIEHGRQNRFNQ